MFSSDDVRKQLSLLGYRDVPEEILGKFVDRLRSAQALHQAGNVHQQDNRDFEDGPSTHERPEPKLQPKQKKANKTPFVEVAPRAASKIAKSSDTENVRLHPNLGDDSFTQQDGDNQDARRQVQRQQLAIALAEKKRLLKQLQRNQPKTDEADQPEENSFSDQDKSLSDEEQTEVKATVNALPSKALLQISSSKMKLAQAIPDTARSIRSSSRPILRTESQPGLRVRPMTARRKVKPGQLAVKSDPVSRFHQYNAHWKKNSLVHKFAPKSGNPGAN